MKTVLLFYVLVAMDTENHLTNKTESLPHYRIVTRILPPYTMYDSITNTYSGYCIDLLFNFQKAWNFTYDIYLPADGRVGVVDENGTWTGMMKEIADNRADIGLSLIAISTEKDLVCDYTDQIEKDTGYLIMIKKPKQTQSFFDFITILDYKLWFCIIGAYFFTCFLLWIFDRWSPYSRRNNHQKNIHQQNSPEIVFKIKECVWLCLTSLTPQGCGIVPQNISGKLVVVTWWIFGFIFLAIYNVNLAIILTETNIESTINSVDDLVNQQIIQYTTFQGSNTYDYFRKMAYVESKFYELWKDMTLFNPDLEDERTNYAVWNYPYKKKYTRMVEMMQSFGFISNISEALERMQNSKVPLALIDAAPRLKYMTLTNCDYMIMGEEFDEKPVALIVQKDSTLKDKMNDVISVMKLNGELDRLHEKWWKIAGACEEVDFDHTPIGLGTVGGAFFIIVLGVISAYIGLFIECYFFRSNQGANSKVQKSQTVRLGHRPAPLPNQIF